MIWLTFILGHVFTHKDSHYCDDDNQSHKYEATNNASNNHREVVYRDNNKQTMSIQK